MVCACASLPKFMDPFKSNMKRLVFFCLAAFCVVNARAATLATIEMSIGSIELELYDEDKPVTVSNFIKYAQSGRYQNSFVHRWVTNFVFQGGGFFVTNTASGPLIVDIPTDPPIVNEYSVGDTFSNQYGTIAMARSQATNSATSQWFINVSDNSFLDFDKGGFTVFGRVFSGTNVLNRFIPPVGTQGIHRVAVQNAPALQELPVLDPNPGIEDLLYTNIRLRREMGVKITSGRFGKTISWNSVTKVGNVIEFSTNGQTWQTLTNVAGTGAVMVVGDSSGDRSRLYRVRLEY